MDSSAPIEELPEVRSWQLTAADRCDGCGARAYFRATIPNGTLLFCVHHGNEHFAKLSAIVTEWLDESARLTEAVKPGD